MNSKFNTLFNKIISQWYIKKFINQSDYYDPNGNKLLPIDIVNKFLNLKLIGFNWDNSKSNVENIANLLDMIETIPNKKDISYYYINDIFYWLTHAVLSEEQNYELQQFFQERHDLDELNKADLSLAKQLNPRLK